MQASADATNADQVEFKSVDVDCSTFVEGSDVSSQIVTGPGSPPGSYGPVTLPLSSLSQCWNIHAIATNACDTATDVHLINNNSCFRRATGDQVILSNDLSMAGGRLQVVVNGSSASYPGSGRSSAVAQTRAGENRIEATVVQASKPGLWRLELPVDSIKAGSLRVVAGETVLIAPTSVTVRLKGTPGERVVILFTRP